MWAVELTNGAMTSATGHIHARAAEAMRPHSRRAVTGARIIPQRARSCSVYFLSSGSHRTPDLDSSVGHRVTSLGMMVLYFGFILLVAYNKPLLARIVVPGLSLGILLGALVIVAAWILIWIYVRWANTHYDAAIDALRGRT